MSAALPVETIGAGPPTVLTIHGAPGTDRALFRPYLDGLAAAARLAFFDLPGHGASAPPADYSFAAMTDAIDRVRAELACARVTLLGSSYGGFLALEYALRYPERVDRLILVDTAASYGFFAESRKVASERAGPRTLAALEALWDGSLAGDEEFADAWAEVLPLYFHALDRAAVHALAARHRYRLATRRAIVPALRAYDVRARLAEIRVPALVCAGAHDWITSVAQARELAQGLPRGELVIFEESGHYPFVEETARFIQTVAAFLRRAAART